MIRIAAVVEGYGDVQALPVLLGRIGGQLGQSFIASDPIRAGEWKLLKGLGRLEKSLDLAHSRRPDLILVALDLDDGCVLQELQHAEQRINDWKNGRTIEVEVAFLAREYETMFLHAAASLNLPNSSAIPQNPDMIRGAKERMKDIMGRRYRETQDQRAFSGSVDLTLLYNASRPFRRLCRAVSGMDYATLDPYFL